MSEAATKKRRPITAQMERDALLLAFMRDAKAHGLLEAKFIAEIAEILQEPGAEPTMQEVVWLDAARVTLAAVLNSRGK